jgi:hypothetical protein
MAGWLVVMAAAEVLAVNGADVDPAEIVTDAGTVSWLWLLERLTTTPPAGAGPDSSTVHEVEADEPSNAGVQFTNPTTVWVTTCNGSVMDVPFRVAEIVAAWLLLTFPAVAMNEALEDPELTVTSVGTTTDGLLLENETAVPAAGAFFVIVTSQLAPAPEVMIVGVQDRVLMAADAVSVKVAVLDVPLKVAVTTAVWSEVTTPLVAVNVDEVEPAAKVTDAGTVSDALLLERETTAPPDAAGPESETVQMEEVLLPSVVGTQVSVLNTDEKVREKAAVCEVEL